MKKGFSVRLIACGVLVGLGFGALVVKLLVIQIRDRGRLAAYADRQLRRALRVRAKRGDILDDRGRPLAVSMDAFSLYANPREVKNPVMVSRRLSKILGLPPAKLNKKLRRRGSYVWLKRKLTPEQKDQVGALKEPGLGFVTESRRFYPKREMASSLLGFVGVDENGLAGVELARDADMKGRPGRIRIERDARGRSIHPEATVVAQSDPGADIRLTVDEVIQYIVEKELTLQLERSGARRAIGVMVEPATGRILSMATVPGYNPNTYGSYKPERWKQDAVQNIYEPGSTFKIITAAAYLDSGGKLSRSYFAENGRFPIGRSHLVLRDHKKYGWLTAEGVIVNSSNIGTYKMAMDVGASRIHRMARRFGFGSKSGIDFPGEAKGILRPVKRWSSTSLASISIGQEVGVTPLQMVMAVAAVANGGLMNRPRIVEAVEKIGFFRRRIGASRPKRVISASHAKKLGGILRKVVTHGTGVSAEVPGYGAAGKTGTAQKAEPGIRGYSKTKFITSFAGFIPYKDPRIALLVVFDEGKIRSAAWGSTIAAPAWKRIAWQTMRYLRVPPEGARVVTLRDEILPSGRQARAEKVSFGERAFRMVERVRDVLHDRPVYPRQPERVR
ncbi:MAG: penicillin-binding protein [Nitrospinae bacterium]|nr:penicillin-binding protein [Nitrospinota bacterium]